MRQVGFVKGPVGLKGNIVVNDLTGNVSGIKAGTKLKIGFSESFASEYTVASIKAFSKSIELKLTGIDSPESALHLKQKAVFADESLFADEEGSVLIGDLLGVQGVGGFTVVEKSTGKTIGKIIDVWLLPANDVWVVETPRGKLPLPVIDDVIRKVNKRKRIIEIEMIDGLEELIEKESN